jgi:ABC-2 type transport system permease protein
MKKFWLVFAHEYQRHVLRKRFLLAILSMPLMVVFMVAVSLFSVLIQFNGKPVGYIDQSSVFSQATDQPKSDPLFAPVKMLPMADEETARIALKNGEIQSYFIIPADYLQTGNVQLVSLQSSAPNVADDVRSFLKFNLLKSQPEDVVTRLTAGSEFVMKSLDEKRTMSENDWMSFVLPLVAGILFVIAVNVSGGYLLQAVVEEKENRTMEIIITSVSPNQLMAGKVLADMAVGLTQLFAWLLFLLLAIFIAVRFLPFNINISLAPGFVTLMLAALLPAFVLVASLMAIAGAMASDTREAQQISGLLTLPVFIPYWLVTPIMMNPNSPLAIGLSLFPLTAPVALPLRAAVAQVPIWQNVLGVALLTVFAAGALWLAGRTFRMGMLRYGKRLAWREVFSRSV